ncbi:hypothetical protein [Catellatospora sp. NPDC049133]|jgi:hypothetical protein|uniref:hypothetical protein n=1 Tax=Catellatospora sp. NPDC049133 TaxID=3155499 RepID=UPI0033F7C107
MRINLPTPRTLVRFLLCFVAGLHVLSLGGNYLYHGLGHHNVIPAFAWWTTFFNVDKEKNLPTWFSGALLLLAAYVLWEIANNVAARGEKYAKHWRILSVVFAFLSMDEITQMHEMSRKMGLVNLGKASYLSWIVVAAPFVLVFCVSYLKFLFHLPVRTRLLVAGGGVLFVLGAVGMEVVGAFVGRDVSGNVAPGTGYMEYLLAASVEELCEMLGVITFFYAMSSYLYERQQQDALAAPGAPVQLAAARSRRQPVAAGAARHGDTAAR